MLAGPTDGQGWAAATATVPLDEKSFLWLEGQARLFDDAERLGQILLRPAIGYRIGKADSIFLGYAYVRTDQLAGPDTQEHRIWQQILFRVAGDGQGATLNGRSRLEQRFVEGSGDMGLRYRQMLRITAPLSEKTRVVGWGEGFFALNDTKWGQRAGFDRARGFAGFAVPLGKAVIEPGYMHEKIRLRGPNRTNHIASVTINLAY